MAEQQPESGRTPVAQKKVQQRISSGEKTLATVTVTAMVKALIVMMTVEDHEDEEQRWMQQKAVKTEAPSTAGSM